MAVADKTRGELRTDERLNPEEHLLPLLPSVPIFLHSSADTDSKDLQKCQMGQIGRGRERGRGPDRHTFSAVPA